MSKAMKNDPRKKLTTVEGEIIYRPKKYPLEMVEANEVYILQTSCFINESLYDGELPLINSTFVGEDGRASALALNAKMFDSCEDAMNYAIENIKFYVGEDGNVYPRVLKVRTSCIVEGVAFEPVIRGIEGGKKLEGVA